MFLLTVNGRCRTVLEITVLPVNKQLAAEFSALLFIPAFSTGVDHHIMAYLGRFLSLAVLFGFVTAGLHKRTGKAYCV